MKKNYLVVGGTSGIGSEVVTMLRDNETRIFVLSRGEHPVADHPDVSHHVCDVTADSPVFPEIEEHLNGLAYLPGSITLKPFHLLREKNFEDDLRINLLGAVRTLQRYLDNLKRAEDASIVLMSTVAVQTGLPYHASIASAKGAVEGLTRSLAAELAPKVRVNAVAPSLTDTPLATSLLNQESKRESAAQRHPLKRVGSPGDIAGAVNFLLSDRSAWMTGQILHVDGGLSDVRSL
jgi:NAD(P)-dependent dehydrogenase (short-subunit alcohol dehydrogenase family)